MKQRGHHRPELELMCGDFSTLPEALRWILWLEKSFCFVAKLCEIHPISLSTFIASFLFETGTVVRSLSCVSHETAFV